MPQEHAAGDVALFWDQDAGFDPTEYVGGEEVFAKIIPVSGAGVLPMEEAEAMEVDIVGRAWRPYAPGDLRINGESYLPDAYLVGEVEVTWTHRDRLQQTSGVLVDATAGNIGPEAGTLYRLRGYVDGELIDTIDDIDGTSVAYTPSASGLVRVEIHAKRDGVYSFQAPSHTFLNSKTRLTEDGDARFTEHGDDRVLEED